MALKLCAAVFSVCSSNPTRWFLVFIQVDKLRIHLKYFCGDGAERTEAQSRQHRNAESSSNNRRNASRGDKRGTKSSMKSDENMVKKKPVKKTNLPRSKLESKSFSNHIDSIDNDSESDLSELQAKGSKKGDLRARISRAAATKAKSRLSAAARLWDNDSSDDDDDYDDASSSNVDVDEDDSVSSSEDEAIKRARLKQEQALAETKSRSKQKSPNRNDLKKKNSDSNKENK